MNDIYKFINKAKLNAVLKPIDRAHGLPNECYQEGPYNKIERKKIFENNWTVIGTASSLKNSGDVKQFNLLGIPLIIVRDNELKIRVFHNVCSHRGLKLINKDCNLKNLIRCPYHSWSYNFNGNLVATPHIGGINLHHHNKFNKDKNGLKEVNSFIWLDLIFVNISNTAIDFNDYITATIVYPDPTSPCSNLKFFCLYSISLLIFFNADIWSSVSLIFKLLIILS